MRKTYRISLIVCAIASVLWHTLNILLINPKYELLDPSKPFVTRFFHAYYAVLVMFVGLAFVETDIRGNWLPLLIFPFLWVFLVRFMARSTLFLIKDKTPEPIRQKHALIMGVVFSIYLPLSSKLASTPLFQNWNPIFVSALVVALLNIVYEIRLNAWLKKNPT